jgi:hypothetical protein
LLEVGLHQCPSERKGEGGPVRSLHVPSHVPNHPQNAAKVRSFSRTASAFTAETDCLLERSGFEPLVPLLQRALLLAGIQDRGTKTETFRSGPRPRCLPPGALSQPFRSRWDHEFESGFLQRRVRCEPDAPID